MWGPEGTCVWQGYFLAVSKAIDGRRDRKRGGLTQSCLSIVAEKKKKTSQCIWKHFHRGPLALRDNEIIETILNN